MSYLVCHIEKYKMHQVAPIGHHNNRDSDKHSNLDIDPELKHLNFFAFTGEAGNPKVNYKKRIDSVMSAEYKMTRKPRRDAVMMVGIIVTSEKSFFEFMDESEIKRFFRCAAEFLGNRYGMSNLIDAKVHMDETTPHMHYEFVPIVEGHLSSKRLFDKWKLQLLHSEFAEYMKKHKFEISRGIEASGLKHIPIPQLKRDTFRAMHDLETQSEIARAVEDDFKKFRNEIIGTSFEEQYGNVMDDMMAFMRTYKKIIYEAAHNLRKRRELEGIVKRVQASNKLLEEQNSRYRQMLKGHSI